jgi:hypothetical protein
MRMKNHLALLLMLAVPCAAAPDERAQLKPCSEEKKVPKAPGEVVRLFELHKDKNPDNVLVIHTYADDSCKLVGSMENKGKLVDMYWRMNDGKSDECYKPTHSKIKSETLKTLDVKSLSADKKKLVIDITQLDQLEHDLPSRNAEITVSKKGDGCGAEAKLPMSRNGDVLSLQEINAKGKYRMGIPRREIESLELKGVDSSGKPAKRLFKEK